MTIIDPPSGWQYGFPKPIPEERKKDTKVWLVEQGYPKKLIDEYGDFFMCRYWEESETNKEINMEEQPKLEQATFEFSQEGNCVDGDIELLTIRCDSSLGIDRDGGCFYILKTEGWAIESGEELQKLFDRISKVINKNYGTTNSSRLDS